MHIVQVYLSFKPNGELILNVMDIFVFISRSRDRNICVVYFSRSANKAILNFRKVSFSQRVLKDYQTELFQ